VIFDDHHLGTSMPSGRHPPHQLVARQAKLGSAGLYLYANGIPTPILTACMMFCWLKIILVTFA
jgi:hypothetical protein